VNALMKRLGYRGRQTAHGFRHLISTSLNERNYNPDWIERALAHGDPNKIRGKYNEAHYMSGRRKMMQEWADILETYGCSHLISFDNDRNLIARDQN
jgi:integrase